MRFLHRFALRRPGVAVAAAMLVTLAAAPGLLRLRLATDGHELLPADDPGVRYDRALRRELDLREPVAVVVWSRVPEGVFDPRTLRAVRDLTARLAAIGGIGREHVMSLATEPGLRTLAGTLHHRALLDPLPRTASEIARLRRDLDRLPIYRGVLISRDRRGAAILVEIPPETDRRHTVEAIRRCVREGAPAGSTVDVVGAPVAEALLGDHLLADLGIPRRWLASGEPTRGVPLLPLALGWMAMVFWLAFRRLTAALLPLLEVAVCLTVVFGALGWVGIPVHLTTAVLPVVLTAVGTADEIHILRRLRETVGRRGASEAPWRTVVSETMEEIAAPVTATSVTTAVAFLSFALSPIVPVRLFGLAAAAGVLVCLLFSLAVVPALLLWLPPARLLPATREDREIETAGTRFSALARLAVARPRAVLTLAALGVAVLAVAGLPALQVQDSWAGGLAPGSPLAGAIGHFETGFLGSHVLRVVVEGRRVEASGRVAAEAIDHHRLTLVGDVPAGDALAGVGPEELRDASLRVEVAEGADRATGGRVDGRTWDTWVESARRSERGWRLDLPPFGGSLRLALTPRSGETFRWRIVSEPFRRPRPLAAVADLERFLARQPGVGGVLGPAAYLRTAYDLATGRGRRLPDRPDQVAAAWSNYEALRGPARLRETVDPDGWRRAIVTVFLHGASYRDSGRLLARLDGWWREHLGPRGLTVRTAGDVVQSRALIRTLVGTQLRSLGLSLVAITLVVALLGKSWRWGLAALLPPALAVTVAFSAMGAAGIPLGVATSMFAAIVLGVGVDGAIHLLTRLRRARDAGRDAAAAIADALTGAGPAIALDALAVGGGFGLLAVSRVPANAHLGMLLALAMAVCLAADLLLLPAVWGLRCRVERRVLGGLQSGGDEAGDQEGRAARRRHPGAVVAGSHVAGVRLDSDPPLG